MFRYCKLVIIVDHNILLCYIVIFISLVLHRRASQVVIFVFIVWCVPTASHDVRLADTIIRTGVLPAGIATAVAPAQGPGVPHAHEL